MILPFIIITSWEKYFSPFFDGKYWLKKITALIHLYDYLGFFNYYGCPD